MESILKAEQLAPTHNTESRRVSSFAFPMMVLFGTYTVWIAVGGLILLVLNVF